DALLVVNLGMFRADFDGLVEAVDRSPVVVFAVTEDTPDGKVGGRMIRKQANGLVESGDGFVRLPVQTEGVAEFVMKLDRFRVDFDGLLESRDGFLQLPMLTLGPAEVAIETDHFRIEFDGLFESSALRLRLVLIAQGVAE